MPQIFFTVALRHGLTLSRHPQRAAKAAVKVEICLIKKGYCLHGNSPSKLRYLSVFLFHYFGGTYRTIGVFGNFYYHLAITRCLNPAALKVNITYRCGHILGLNLLDT